MATGVGIDVSKDTVDVAVHGQGYLSQFSRDAEGLAAVVSALEGLEVHRVLIEASGGYEQLVSLDDGLFKAHLPSGLLRLAATELLPASLTHRFTRIAEEVMPAFRD